LITKSTGVEFQALYTVTDNVAGCVGSYTPGKVNTIYGGVPNGGLMNISFAYSKSNSYRLFK
jgi:hypothetical protein